MMIRMIPSFLATLAMTSTMALLASTTAYAIDAGALPQGGNVAAGSVTFSNPTATSLTVNQSTERSVINWTSFNIGQNASVQFQQPDAQSLTVNRVVNSSASPTQILGALQSNGQLMILDKNGVLFGSTAVINVGGIIASTGDVDNDQIMSGASSIDITGISGNSVINQGQITAAQGGLVALVAPYASNSGIITANMGRVELAAGSAVTVDLYGDNLVSLAVNGPVANALVENTGTIQADGGRVALTASAAQGVVNNVINMTGIIQANTVGEQGGVIVLDGGSAGTVNASGQINAMGGATGGNGGQVEISGASLNFNSLVNTTAPNGTVGTLLLDPADVTIGNSRTQPNGTYLNAQQIADDLVVTSIIVQATGAITIADNSDLSTSTQGTPQYDLSLISPTLNVNNNLNMAAAGNLYLTANTINLNSELTSVGAAINPSRVISTATQVNVLSPAASIQQGMDIASATAPVTVQVSAGSYNENLTINKAGLTLTGLTDTGATGADPAAPQISGTIAGGNVITVAANNVTIDGLILNAQVGDGSVANSANGIYANGVDSLTISQNTFNGWLTTSGIATPNSTNVTLNANQYSLEYNAAAADAEAAAADAAAAASAADANAAALDAAAAAADAAAATAAQTASAAAAQAATAQAAAAAASATAQTAAAAAAQDTTNAATAAATAAAAQAAAANAYATAKAALLTSIANDKAAAIAQANQTKAAAVADADAAKAAADAAAKTEKDDADAAAKAALVAAKAGATPAQKAAAVAAYQQEVTDAAIADLAARFEAGEEAKDAVIEANADAAAAKEAALDDAQTAKLQVNADAAAAQTAANTTAQTDATDAAQAAALEQTADAEAAQDAAYAATLTTDAQAAQATADADAQASATAAATAASADAAAAAADAAAQAADAAAAAAAAIAATYTQQGS